MRLTQDTPTCVNEYYGVKVKSVDIVVQRSEKKNAAKVNRREEEVVQ